MKALCTFSSYISATTLIALISISSDAMANSRFTVQNDSVEKVLVNIFNGGDNECLAESKHHTVGSGNHQGMGCEGQGKHRCKVRVSIDKKQICQNILNACGDNSTRIKNHATIVIESDGVNCRIIED